MPPARSAAEQRRATQTALADFARLPLPKAARALLGGLGYSSDNTVDLGSKPTEFVANLKQFGKAPAAFDEKKAQVTQWRSAHFVFQIRATTFGVLVDTANLHLMKLRDRLAIRYGDKPTDSLMECVFAKPRQVEAPLN